VVPVCEGSRDIAVIFFFFRVLCDIWYLYPLWAYMYSYVYVHLYLYVFLT
jgi:hypothetical protein